MEVWCQQSFGHLINIHMISTAAMHNWSCKVALSPEVKQDSTSQYVGMATIMTLMVACMCSKYEALPRDAMNTLQWAVID